MSPLFTPQARTHDAALRTTLATWLGDKSWRPVETGDASAAAVTSVVRQVLDRAEDGDHVFIEPTLGPRSLSLGLVTAAFFLRALRPEVTLERFLYAEGIHPKFTIRDITESVNLIDWAGHAQAFASGLNPMGIFAGLGLSHDALRDGLGLGLSPRLIGALRGRPLDAVSTTSPQAQHAKAFVQRHLGPPSEAAAKTVPDRLDREWLTAELEVVELFRRAGRWGDSIRILREWCVNVVLLAQGGSPKWAEHAGRRRAEFWLGSRTGPRRSVVPAELTGLVKVFEFAGRLRNALSHAGYDGGESAPLPGLAGGGDVSSTVDRVVTDARDWWSSLSAVPTITSPPKDTALYIGVERTVALEQSVRGLAGPGSRTSTWESPSTRQPQRRSSGRR